MLNFGASKPRVKGGPGSPGPPLDPRLRLQYHIWSHEHVNKSSTTYWKISNVEHLFQPNLKYTCSL